ncbi:MAG TPA: glycerol-3-phosphate dehydrogenase [Dongiaceae bacterium]|nr:glycerol-3-phosphate dehydrogenase [Dongiaceae bacterium]
MSSNTPGSDQPVYDLAIIGGGINGCGIARDAAGRGLKVFVCEKSDLASATSSASTKLIHGGLRYLEYYEFRLVREALTEREVMWSVAPHIIWPLRFVLPHHKGLRPAWLLRLGLFLYDHLGGRKYLPATRSLRLDRDPAGAPLKPIYTRGFEYSDCWVEDARLVALNARDAVEKGAEVVTRTRCSRAERKDNLWHLTLVDERSGVQREIRARALVNAAGPWVGNVVHSVLRDNHPAPVRLVQGSHIVTKRLFDHDRCYIFQNSDGRIFFAIPYERDFTLVGTTDQDYHGDPAQVKISQAEIDYLCKGASDYFKKPITSDQVVWSYSGVRPLYDDGASAAQAATRDYVLKLDAPENQPALLTVYGGKITTYRRLAESALATLAPHLPAATKRPIGWTGKEPLPGGDFKMTAFDAELARVKQRYPFLPETTARRLFRAYGTRIDDLIGAARQFSDLGAVLGADLTEAEVRYLVRYEWAMAAEDILWRRSKLGLRLSAEEVAAVQECVARALAERQAA